MTPPFSKFALTAHVALSVGWLGAVVAYSSRNRGSDQPGSSNRARRLFLARVYRLVCHRSAQSRRATKRAHPVTRHPVGFVQVSLGPGEVLADRRRDHRLTGAHAGSESHG